LSRYLTWLCVVIRIHHVLYRIGASCSNCGVRRPTDGLCSRCLDLPYCKICKRHLPVCCFNEAQRKICQVHLQIILFFTRYHQMYFTYRYKLDYYLTYHYRYTFSRLYMFTELWKAAHQTTYSTKQRHIRNFPTRDPIQHLFRNADQHPSTRHRRHRSRRLTAARVLTRLFFYSLQPLIVANSSHF